MAYKYTYFDAVALPPYNRASDLSISVEGGMIAALGGGFDAAGGVRRLPRVHPIGIKGIYANDTEYLVDESGNNLVDQSGNYWISSSEARLVFLIPFQKPSNFRPQYGRVMDGRMLSS